MDKFLTLLCAVLCSSTIGYSQSKPFKKLADELNALTGAYGGLYPFTEPRVALKEYGLTYKDFPDTNENSYAEYFSPKKDSIDTYGLQEYYNAKIRIKLAELTVHADFGKAGNEKLVTIFATKSADSKVYNFIYDENTGGSYQSRVSYVYHSGQKGGQNQELYNPDGYDTIIPLKSKAATRYLMMGENIGCNSCMGHYAKVVHYDKGLPVVDFEYEFVTRMGYENSIEYNPTTKTISIIHTTDDISSYCWCRNEELDDGSEKTVHVMDENARCYCIYKFNGETFILVSSTKEEVKN